ncbi:hypothetical protein [Nocardioides flavescens]|uniref:Uncharacterized protein n=1 Tax=Nocardioides flavescens TaxID=2691959 RepID=A0A6L7F4L0_9ACTN|nr:hypothetical protein [Nocardioides flavescens]MXG92101.1 hypothetical protein [Nocardioides flavescens]
MTAHPPEEELARRLTALAEPVRSPLPPSEIDRLARLGRRRMRRTRAATTLAVSGLAASAVAIGVSAAPGDRGSSPDDASYASDPAATTAAPTAGPSSGPTSGPTSGSSATGSCASGPVEGRGPLGGHGATLRTYRDLLAAHLDPTGQHLAAAVSNVQSGSDRCGLNSLGTKLGWSSPTGPGLGMVQVEVTTGPWAQAQVRMSREGWQRLPDLPTGVVAGWASEDQSGRAVGLTRADGTTVAVEVDALFGNDSLTPVDGIDLSTEQLVAAAADPGFVLPAP